MNKRVFQIDQECFIIFVEELSSKKERFLRIGNSPELKKYKGELTFITLLSRLYPGDLFRELDIFTPAVDKKIVGLKTITSGFLNFLETNGVKTKGVKIIYAEEEEKWVENRSKTEKDFIDKISVKSKKSAAHSFASFYENGNIRIFNKSELIFDLENAMKNSLDEKKEILELSKYFASFYSASYKKSGIINSGKSFFIFSEGYFACITDSKSWIKDAVRVGINPFDIELIYFTDGVKLDSLWIKFFISYERKEKGVQLLSREKPSWGSIVPEGDVLYLNPFAKPINYSLGKIGLVFKKENIIIKHGEISLTLDSLEFFKEKNGVILGDCLSDGKKTKFKLTVNSFEKDALALYKYNPCIFGNTFDKSDYIKSFWESIKFDRKIFNHKTDLTDENYSENIISEIDKKSFYSQLFAETVKRIDIEGNKKVSDETIEEFKNKLSGLKGKTINKNNLIIEQLLAFDGKTKRAGIRDIAAETDFTYIDDEANPFLHFEKDKNKKEWTKYLTEFRDKYKKSLSDERAELLSRRFNDVIGRKKFHTEEIERLKRFIENVIINEKQTEKLAAVKTNVNKTEPDNKENDNKSQIKKEKEESRKIFSLGFAGIKFEMSKKVLLPAAVIFIIAALLCGGFFYIKSTGIKENSVIAKLKVFKKDQDKYKKSENGSRVNKQSSKFHFYMTTRDLLNLTNKVAERNGYHKITAKSQKSSASGKDPDWIFPGNKLTLPDDKIIDIKNGDTMWEICDTFLNNQLNADELKIETMIKDIKAGKTTFEEAKKELLLMKERSFSEMFKDLVDYIIQMKNFREIEDYLKKNYSK